MYIVDKGERYHRRRRPFYEGGMQTGRQADRQTDRQAKRKKREENINQPPKTRRASCFALLYLLYSLSLSPYYLTLMPFSFGVDDTSFAPFFD